MSFFKKPKAFFSAAAVVLAGVASVASPLTLFADDEDDSTTQIWNLSGSTDFTISSGETVVLTQDIDGTYTGTISGEGALEKYGDATLTLDGEIALEYSNSIVVYEGTLTLGNNLTLPSNAFSITNAGTIVISKNGDEELQLTVLDSDFVGTVINNGAGTVQVSQLYGNALNVEAGTLIVTTTAQFNEIYVADGATLQIGTGETDSLASLAGDVLLAGEDATLIFNRAALTGSSSSDFSYEGEISGEGEVVFDGTQEVLFTGGVDQTYTGKTTVNAGGMIFDRDAEGTATLSSSEIEVNGGALFGGNVNVIGNVTVNGTTFTSYDDWESSVGEDTFGAWYEGAGVLFADGGDTLTIDGDLSIAETEAYYYYTVDSDGNITSIDVAGNSGGAIRVNFTSAGAGKIVANGNVSLGGTIILVGSSSVKVGQIAVIFESDTDKTTGEFTQVVYGSDNVILLTPGIGGIEEGQYGAATVESRNVRERSSFEEHDGIEDLVDYLEDNADEINELVQAVAIADGDDVTDVVNNLSPLAYCALAEMAQRQSDLELDMILQNIARARRYNRPESEDGVRVPANFSFFSGVIADDFDHDDDTDAAIYDLTAIGVYAGGYTWIDDERIVGASLGAYRSTATMHGNGGTIDDVALRAKVFATFTPKFAEWFLTVGGTFGLHHYDVDRDTALGNNDGSLHGLDAGLFVALNYRKALAAGWFLTPYLRFEYNFHYAGSVTEHGSQSRLELEHFVTNSYRTRFGTGFERSFGEAKTFGIDLGFVAVLGKKPRISAEFVEYDDSDMTVYGTVNEGLLMEVTPRMSLGFGDGWTFDMLWRIQSSFGGAISQSIGLGIGKSF